MWIRVYPSWKTNFKSKNGTNKVSYVTKASIQLSQWVESICVAQSLKERILLCESMFIPIEKWALVLRKAQREVFPVKPKHQFIYPLE